MPSHPTDHASVGAINHDKKGVENEETSPNNAANTLRAGLCLHGHGPLGGSLEGSVLELVAMDAAAARIGRMMV